MARSSISVGTDTPTGEPANGPSGPYISAEHDDEMAAGGQDPTRKKPGGSRTETKIARESALGSDNAGEHAGCEPARGVREQTPDMPDELARRPKGPAQP